MTALQRSTSRTLHLRSRETSGGGGVAVGAPRSSSGSGHASTASGSNHYSRPVQRSGPPVVIHLEPVRSAATNPAASDSAASGTPAVRPVASDTLLRGAKVVQIMHNGEAYQLRATRHGKLILTK